MKTQLMKALHNLKYQFKRKKKYQIEAPTENAPEEDCSKGRFY
jgi:hypothetical protein